MSFIRRSISQASTPLGIKSSTSYASHNWFFLKNNINPPKPKKISQYYSTCYHPTFKGETEQLFTNTMISFTPQERQLMEIAQDNKLQNLRLTSGGESRIDIAKSAHTLSVINLNKEREIAEEKERQKKEEKKAVIDDEELFSSRNESYPNVTVEPKIQRQEDGATKFITEMSEEQIRVQELDKEHLKELIHNSIEMPTGYQYNSIGQYKMGIGLNKGERKLKQAFRQSCYSQNEKFVSPLLNSFPNPVNENTFAINKMRNQNHL